MAGKVFKLKFTSAASADGVATIKIPQKCRARCISWSIVGIGGAAVSGHHNYELSKQATSQLTTNDTPGTVLSSCAIPFPVSGGSNSVNANHACDLDLDSGDNLYINAVFTGGAAAASILGQCYIYT